MNQTDLLKIDPVVELNQLIKEISLTENIHPDEAFILWFLQTYLVDNKEEALASITGRSNDKALDAIYVDHKARQVNLIQGKYRVKGAEKAELASEVVRFAQLGRLVTDEKDNLSEVIKSADASIVEKLHGARKQYRNKGYEINLFYVTTGRISTSTLREAKAIVEHNSSINFISFHGNAIKKLITDYIMGAAPAVPILELEVEGPLIMTRHDPDNEIDSYVFTMKGKNIGDLVNKGGSRIFARNIRGFLGDDTAVNRSITETLKSEPHNFWYFNNGVTIICDEAHECSTAGKKALRIREPYIINGQQTARTLNRFGNDQATLLVKVISIPRSEDQKDYQKYETLVSQIVTATNWQNKIVASDLKSNDREQIRIERELRKLGILYIRKKMSKKEAKSTAVIKPRYIIKKEDLAQAVASVVLDPFYARSGKEPLFETDLYKQIFPYNRDICEYLTYYHLARVCSYEKDKDADKWGCWLATHILWKNLKGKLKTKSMRKNFVYAYERRNHYWDHICNPLHLATSKIYVGIRKFYKDNSKSKDGKHIGEQTFFKYKNRHNQFESFWQTTPKKRQKLYKNNLDKFIRALEEFEL